MPTWKPSQPESDNAKGIVNVSINQGFVPSADMKRSLISRVLVTCQRPTDRTTLARKLGVHKTTDSIPNRIHPNVVVGEIDPKDLDWVNSQRFAKYLLKSATSLFAAVDRARDRLRIVKIPMPRTYSPAVRHVHW